MTSNSLKKTFFYNFYPSNYEEEMYKTAPLHHGGVPHRQRILLEIRDIHPPPAIDVQNPWQITKTLTKYEVLWGRVVVPFKDAFEYILRYWTLCMAEHAITPMHKVSVDLWDLTDETNPRKYDGNYVYFEITPNDENCVLACMMMMRDRKLKEGDYIGLYWENKDSSFRIKVFGSKALSKR